MNKMTILQKLAANKYELDEGNPHIEVNDEACRAQCPELACLYVCPANVYSEQNGRIVADWAGCLECGTCKVACPPVSLKDPASKPALHVDTPSADRPALRWEYPRGGFGVIYRSG